jgi:hypothetical protein
MQQRQLHSKSSHPLQQIVLLSIFIDHVSSRLVFFFLVCIGQAVLTSSKPFARRVKLFSHSQKYFAASNSSASLLSLAGLN